MPAHRISALLGGAQRPDAAPTLKATRLADYAPPDWLVEDVKLTFELEEAATKVRSQMRLRRNPTAGDGPRPDLRLDGRNLTLLSVELDAEPISEDSYVRDEQGLTVPAEALPGDSFLFEAETEINPRENLALEGLYMSRDMFCTQCEAQGFRKITYFPDRPDVMCVFAVRIEADQARFPVLLSNGNRVSSGALEAGRHFVEWLDPHPKPSYLFALVAGNLTATRDQFVTASGRDVALELFTRPGDESKAHYALDALKRSMRWDETEYGREYDLDLFMIVAVDDFNMGAMENKGLNIFNSKFVLASTDTATDRDYELIESIVAHEYFHNWTGNRITCRDWFQLCLKEGLTVFRDQQFSEDQRSEPVARINAVRALRAAQFREDAGPLAHPVRPEAYVEINNFYTATVYEKGAEIVRMLRTWLGAKVYRAALDLYFERHDGQACTIEDFLKCFEDAAARDLSHFARWWSQAGTPRVGVREAYDANAKEYALTLTQSTPPTANQPAKAPLVIPFAVGLLGADGAALSVAPPKTGDGGSTSEHATDAAAEHVLTLTEAEQTFVFSDVAEAPTLSFNRRFSAPVIVDRALDDATRAFLLSHDGDPFSRWEAGRSFQLDLLRAIVADIEAGRPARDGAALVATLGSALRDPDLDPAFRALVLTLPSIDEISGDIAARPHFEGTPDDDASAPPRGWSDPDAVFAGRTHLQLRLAATLEGDCVQTYDAMATPGPYSPDVDAAAKRALKNACLDLLAKTRKPDHLARVDRQFANADNMSDQMPALTALVHSDAPTAPAALETFFDRWKGDALVLGKWFAVQASSPMETALDRVAALADHPAFDWRNPNKFRSLIGAFAMANPVNFHRRDGAGYRFVADWLIRLDAVNPQTSAKLASAFETWRRYDARRQTLIQGELERIIAAPNLSRDTAEMVDRLLKG